MSVFRTLLMQQDVYDTIYGTNSITFNAKANGLKALTLFGGTEQSGTPTPTTPVDIVCNNGVLTFGVTTTFNTVDGQGTFVSPSSTNTTRIYKAFGKLKAGKYKVKITGDFEFIFQYKDTNDVTPTQYGNIGTWATEGEYELTDENMYYGVAIRNAGGTGTIYPSNFNNIGTIGYTYLVVSPVGTTETIQDNLNNTATAEMLLKVGDYQDKQSILDGVITRNVGVLVLDGVTTGKMFSSAWNATYKRCNLTIPNMLISVAATEDAICNFFPYSSSVNTSPTSLGFCTNNGYLLVSFIEMENITSANDANAWLAQQYQAGTPMIVVYPLATSTTETVAGQTLTTQAGTNMISITQASISSLDLEAKYKKGKSSIYYAYTPEGGTQANSLYSKDIEVYEGNLTLQNISSVGNIYHQGSTIKTFSNDNYLMTDSLTLGNSWELYGSFTPNAVSGTHYILGREYYFDLYLTDDKLTTDVGNGNTWTTIVQEGTTSLQANTKYYFKYQRNGNTYNVYLSTTSTFGNTPEISLPAVDFGLVQISLGKFTGGSGLQPFNGSIDIKDYKLINSGVETVFCNITNKTVLYDNNFNVVNTDFTCHDLTNCNMVGTINNLPDNRVFNNFNTSQYFTKTQNIEQGTSNIKLYFKIKYNSIASEQTLVNNVFDTRILFYDNKLRSWGNFGYYDGSTTFENDKTYWICISATSTKTECYSLEDNNYSKNNLPALSQWTKEIQYDYSLTFSNLNYQIASYNYYYYCGLIDMANSFIDIDGTIISYTDDDIIANSIRYIRTPANDKGKPSTYYAYKDGQGNLIYSKDSTASIDYPLENLTNTDCTDLGDGVYQGGANKYFVTNTTPALATANSWEFKTKVKYVPGGGNPCIFGCSANDCQTPIFGHIIDNQMYALLSSNGSSWDLYATLIKDIDTQETLTLSAYTTYYFKFGFTGTEYYLWYSTVGFDDAGKTLTFLRTSTKVYCAEPLMLLNNHFNLSAFYWAGTIDLTQTNLVINGVETSFCEVIKSTLYNSSLQPMAVQPDYILGKGIEVTDMQNGALILPTQQPVSSMELCVHYKTNNSFPNLQLTGGADETTHSGLYFQNYDSYLNTWISSNGSSYDIASNVNIASGFVNDTEYWLKATWDGTKYEFYTSTDGTNFVKSYQVINSTSPVFWNNSNLYLGNNSAKSFTEVYAKYFLDGTYLKVDGVTVFDGSLGTGYTTDGCTVSGFIKGDIKFNNTIYARSSADDRQA